MKKTLQETSDILNMQYVLEHLIETYDSAKKESERYKVKLILLDFIMDTKIGLDIVLSYLKLDPSKFSPFIAILKDIEETDEDYEDSEDDTERFPFHHGSSQIDTCLIIKRRI